jgi:hypothetical protein
VTANGAACTARIVIPDTPDNAAVIVVVPADTPVANPLLALTVATAGLEEVQAAWLVMFCVLPFE